RRKRIPIATPSMARAGPCNWRQVGGSPPLRETAILRYIARRKRNKGGTATPTDRRLDCGTYQGIFFEITAVYLPVQQHKCRTFRLRCHGRNISRLRISSAGACPRPAIRQPDRAGADAFLRAWLQRSTLRSRDARWAERH